MSWNIDGDNMEEIHRNIMTVLSGEPAREGGNGPDCISSPRGLPVRELINGGFTLRNPRARLITSPTRAVNYGFGVGELCWYVRADTDLATMHYYNRRMAQFSDDGETINSAYGYRIFDWDYAQFDRVIQELKIDPDSRRAVMHINHPTDLIRAVTKGSKDVPCTLSLQLLIRDRRLHMNVVMRSNDVVWGLPYDVFSFTTLQEAFLYRLQEEGVDVVDLGSYNHTAGSLHLYERHLQLAGDVRDEPFPLSTPMRPFALDEIRQLAEDIEPLIRENWKDDNVYSGYTNMREDELSSTLQWWVKRLVDHRNKRIMELKEKDEQIV